MIVPVPPLPLAVAVPFEPPKQLTLVVVVAMVTAVGWVMTTLAVVVQELASVTVTVYVPAVNADFVADVPPPVQLYVYDVVPPVTVAVADPVEPPLHKTFVPVTLALSAVGCVTVALAVVVHELASVTVTVYVPAVNPVFVADVPPPVQA